MRRAVILGGTGAIGGATAARLAARGWHVDVTGRDPAGMPPELRELGVRFHQVARADTAALGQLVGPGVELLVDVVAYSAADVRALLPLMSSAGSSMLISSRAVYVDAAGRDINGGQAPQFPVPVREAQPTLAPAADGVDPFSRSGYAPSKVATEQAALDSGCPVTVIRPSKVHGRWARNPRTRAIVTRMLTHPAQPIQLRDRGQSVDHLTAAANTEALIEVVAEHPGRRILNSADPDPLTATQIIAAIAQLLDWRGHLELLDPAEPGGQHPWYTPHPIVLDTVDAQALGYQPAGTGRALLADEVMWVAASLQLPG